MPVTTFKNAQCKLTASNTFFAVAKEWYLAMVDQIYWLCNRSSYCLFFFGFINNANYVIVRSAS